MDKFRGIRRVLFVTLALNLVSTGLKLGVGVATGSLALVAGGFDALLDASSNLIGLYGVKIAARPPDATHPYGHRKFETLAALVIASMILVMIFEILRNALGRLGSGAVPEVNLWSFLAVAVGLAFEWFTTIYERRQGQALQSEFLLADAAHTGAHVLISLSILVGLFLVRLGYGWADAVLAILIAAAIAKIGWDILRTSSGILADAAVVNPWEVGRVALSVPGVETAERIRSRGPRDDIHIDLEIGVSPSAPLEEAHTIAAAVEKRLQAEIPGVKEVLVHLEPQAEPQAEALLPERVRVVASREGARVHEIRVQEVDEKRVLDLHLEVEENRSLEEAHRLATQLEGRIREEIPGFSQVFVHIEPLEVHATEKGERAAEARRVRQEVDLLVKETAGLRSYHGLAVRRVGDKLFVSLNCVLKENLSVEEAHDLATEFEGRLKEKMPNIDQVLVHLEPPQSGKGG